jgi:adenosine deaminase
MEKHNLPQLLNANLCVTINSDDPAYFGGYINENFSAVCDAFDLNEKQLTVLARNSFEAAVIDEVRRQQILKELDDLVAAS